MFSLKKIVLFLLCVLFCLLGVTLGDDNPGKHGCSHSFRLVTLFIIVHDDDLRIFQPRSYVHVYNFYTT